MANPSANRGFPACFPTVLAKHSYTDNPERVPVPLPDDDKDVVSRFIKICDELATCLRPAHNTKENPGNHRFEQNKLETEKQAKNTESKEIILRNR